MPKIAVAVGVVGLLLSPLAYAAMDVDLNWMVTVTLDKPICSGDYECTKAAEKLNSEAKSKAKEKRKSMGI